MFVSSRKKVLQAFGMQIVKMLALESNEITLEVLNLLTNVLIQQTLYRGVRLETQVKEGIS